MVFCMLTMLTISGMDKFPWLPDGKGNCWKLLQWSRHWGPLPHLCVAQLATYESHLYSFQKHQLDQSWSAFKLIGGNQLKISYSMVQYGFPREVVFCFSKKGIFFWNVTQHTVLILKWSIILKYFRKVPFSKLTVRPWQSSGFCWSVSTQKWWKNQGPTVNLPESTYSLFLGIYQPELL